MAQYNVAETSKDEINQLRTEVQELKAENRYLREFQKLAQDQTGQLEALSASVVTFNKINRKTSQEWTKTIKKMKEAKEELESVFLFMRELQNENKKLKAEIQDLKMNQEKLKTPHPNI